MAQPLNILVTGAAGFIGWKVCEFLLTKPDLVSNDSMTIQVIGIDNLNDYYDVRLKQWRLGQLKKHPNFTFHHLDIEDYSSLKKLFESYSTNSSAAALASILSLSRDHSQPKAPFPRDSAPFAAVINLAARAGVRYSMENPFVYYTTNVMGTLNLLELCKEFNVKKFILASTSSLYAGQKMPFKEDLPVNEPISPYAASKKGDVLYLSSFIWHRYFNIALLHGVRAGIPS
jgi:UDP-glucuronate 4-epimerase